jgi:Integral membrane protein (PIN domain superfamily)
MSWILTNLKGRAFVSNRFLKLAFTLIGVVTAYTLLRVFFISSGLFKDVIIIVVPILSGLLFYFVSDKSLKYLSQEIDSLESFIHSMSVYELIVLAIGLIAGLIVANLISIPFIRIEIIGIPISVGLNILFGVMGIYITMNKRGEASSLLDPNAKKVGVTKLKLIDTSTIIDGRIVDIVNTGFIDGRLIIPSFVLEELHQISDSADSIKRSRGRRGLDVLDALRKDQKLNVSVETIDSFGASEVDDMLIRAAKKYSAQIITNDYNLNKVANIQGVEVLNINDLANSLKPLAIPGDELSVQVVKEGKENGQGIGYMNDGTMIVVEGGRKYMNQNLDVMVTSILQTSAGRMIFAKAKI